MRIATVLIAFTFGCGGKKDEPAGAASGSAPAPAKPGSATGSATAGSAMGSGSGPAPAAGSGSATAGSGSSAAAEPKRPMPAACIPTGFGVRGVEVGLVDGHLVACASDEDELRACWEIDGKSGKVTKRDAAPLPGVGFPVKGHCYKDACWELPKDTKPEDAGAIVAIHPDGKRAAVMTGMEIVLLDLAAKKVTSKWTFEIGNTPAMLWFAGDAIYVRGDDAGPAQRLNVFGLDGKKRDKTFGGMWHGGATVGNGTLVVQEEAVSTVTVLDGDKPTSIERKVAKGPCKPTDQPEWDAMKDDPAQKKCFAHVTRHYAPYDAAELVRDGDGFIGFSAPAGAIFTLDKALVEKTRTKVAMCPSAPE